MAKITAANRRSTDEELLLASLERDLTELDAKVQALGAGQRSKQLAGRVEKLRARFSGHYKVTYEIAAAAKTKTEALKTAQVKAVTFVGSKVFLTGPKGKSFEYSVVGKSSGQIKKVTPSRPSKRGGGHSESFDKGPKKRGGGHGGEVL